MASTRKKVTKSRKGWIRRFGRAISGHGRWWSVTLRWLVFLGVIGVAFSAAAFFALYRLIDIPDPNADFQTQTTHVYYSDGKTQIGEFATQDRESIGIDEIPASMQAAAVAAEDRTFYSNRGIDIKGIVRAARNNATSGEITGGGSTITQQYVKILYLTQEQTIQRKVKEAILSIKIHNQLSKDEILEGYLNTIYFGNGAYGVEVASQEYFRQPASELTVPQSAALATIINSPSYYDPYSEGGLDRMLSRYNYVIDGMEKAGAITTEEASEYRDNLPEFEEKRDNNRFGGEKGFLLSLVQKQLGELEFTEAQIYGGGLRVVTTFDALGQKSAVDAVNSMYDDGLQDLDELHTALVSVEPGTGAVRAMYGGPDYLESQLNWATLATQPGSTFKAFAVVAALENGYSLKTRLDGRSPMRLDGGAVIENQGDSGGASYGTIPLERATEDSVNTAFVDLTLQMDEGAQKVKEAAVQSGIPNGVVADIGAVPVVSLGFAPVSPVDMANAYATFAANGKKADWYTIESVADSRGETLHEHEDSSEQSIPEDVAADVTSALQRVVRSGSGTNARTVCPTAGKTGTATAGDDDSDYQRVSSSWFVGYTPKLATAVMYNRGTGNEALDGYMPTFYGGQYPARTFQAYMNGALDGADCGTFPAAANIQATNGTEYVAPPPPTQRPKPKPTPEPEPSPEPEPEPSPEPEPEPEPEEPTDPPTDPPASPERGNGGANRSPFGESLAGRR